MILTPDWFNVGDVVATGFGPARLVSQEPDDSEGRTTWKVHYQTLDIEMEHAFAELEYLILEVSDSGHSKGV